MSLVVNIAKDDLLSSLAFIQNITTKPGTLAILSNILIETKNDAIEVELDGNKLIIVPQSAILLLVRDEDL